MQKFIAIGNLTSDPTLSQTSGGIPYCRMTIAVNSNYKTKDGEKKADFFNVTCWRGLAENCHKYLKKGSKVGIVGYLQNRTYEQDGVKKYSTDIIADEVEFLNTKTEA